LGGLLHQPAQTPKTLFDRARQRQPVGWVVLPVLRAPPAVTC